MVELILGRESVREWEGPDVSRAREIAALTNRLMALDDSLLACRDMRHAWMVENDYHVTAVGTRGGKIQEIRRVLVCMRCEAVRRVEVYVPSRYGLDKVAQHYEYDPEKGYLMKGVPAGVKPTSIVQGEQYRRALERLAEAEAGASVVAEG